MSVSNYKTDVAVRLPTAASFVTDHLTLASYLSCYGHHPTLVPSGPTKVLFSFFRTPELDKRVQDFHGGAATVNPTQYDSARLKLRRQIDRMIGGAR